MHSWGEVGGSWNPFSTRSPISMSGKIRRRRRSSSRTLARSCGVSRSSLTSPSWGVYRLNQIFLTSSPLGPETRKFLQVTLPLNELPGNRAVDVDPMPGDVLQDAVVSGGRPAAIMFGLKAVNGNGKVKIGKIAPRFGYGPDGAGDQHHFHTHSLQLGKQDLQLTVAHERLTPHDGDVQRAKAPNQSQDPCH